MDKLIKPVTFPSRGSRPLQLEGMLHLLDGAGQWPAAIVCHPHPLGGGTMHNGMVTAIARAMATQGVIALRFNFRGVGRSEGRYDGGQGERSDVAGALDRMLAQPQIDPWRVSLVGYSFGAWVALAHAQTDPRTVAVAAVGLPAWIYDADFAQQNTAPSLGAGGPWQFDPGFMQSFTRPKLFVTGEYDPFAPPQALRRFVERLSLPKKLHIVPGSDHFLQGHEQEVGHLIAGFVAGL